MPIFHTTFDCQPLNPFKGVLYMIAKCISTVSCLYRKLVSPSVPSIWLMRAGNRPMFVITYCNIAIMSVACYPEPAQQLPP